MTESVLGYFIKLNDAMGDQISCLKPTGYLQMTHGMSPFSPGILLLIPHVPKALEKV